jgi:hypothetical protein
VNAYITTLTATAHQASIQLWLNRVGVSYNHIGYNKRDFAAGSASVPNMISAVGLAQANAGDHINIHWGQSDTVTSMTGEPWLGFGVWKVG